MPQVFKIGGYVIYFWMDEGQPQEPVHVHVSKRVPAPNATKIWITRTGKTVVCHNKSKIPIHDLNNICDLIEARSFEIISKWQDYFDQLSFYC